ncbi:MAG: CRISPR-associated ring nuclease Crn3/Csx3 [Candidatus Hadarchaeales archaeon]
MKYKTKEFPEFFLLQFELEGGVISPEELGKAVEAAPQLPGNKGVVISGRGPVWLFAALCHKYHPCVWVATHDPRLGAVVVETHVKERKVGEVIPLPSP